MANKKTIGEVKRELKELEKEEIKDREYDIAYYSKKLQLEIMLGDFSQRFRRSLGTRFIFGLTYLEPSTVALYVKIVKCLLDNGQIIYKEKAIFGDYDNGLTMEELFEKLKDEINISFDEYKRFFLNSGCDDGAMIPDISPEKADIIEKTKKGYSIIDKEKALLWLKFMEELVDI